jgi:hypothetical protein
MESLKGSAYRASLEQAVKAREVALGNIREDLGEARDLRVEDLAALKPSELERIERDGAKGVEGVMKSYDMAREREHDTGYSAGRSLER